MSQLKCPDPEKDWEGYILWMEIYRCETCDGAGSIDSDDDFEITCESCGGIGSIIPSDEDQL